VNGASSGTQALSLTVNAASGGGAAGGGSTSIIVGVGAGGTYITPTSTPSSTVELKALISSLEAQLKLLLQQAAARSIIVPAGTSSSTLIFTKNLTLGSSGPDVAALQRYLNTHGFPVVTTPGFAGSLGYETQHFGVSTQTAVAKLQKSVGIVPISGFFGPITRAWVNTHQQQ
jgi:murein L,D-transpeptidase YcbB/YkuD